MMGLTLQQGDFGKRWGKKDITIVHKHLYLFYIYAQAQQEKQIEKTKETAEFINTGAVLGLPIFSSPS